MPGSAWRSLEAFGLRAAAPQATTPAILSSSHLVFLAADGGQDFVAVLVELGATLDGRRCIAELHRRRHEPVRNSVGRGCFADVAVRHGLGVFDDLEGVLSDRPLPLEVRPA